MCSRYCTNIHTILSRTLFSVPYLHTAFFFSFDCYFSSEIETYTTRYNLGPILGLSFLLVYFGCRNSQQASKKSGYFITT